MIPFISWITTIQVIKKPMDLSLIRQRIMSGALLSLDDMSRDLFVMCTNAMVFNGKGDPYFDYSKVLRERAASWTALLSGSCDGVRALCSHHDVCVTWDIMAVDSVQASEIECF